MGTPDCPCFICPQSASTARPREPYIAQQNVWNHRWADISDFAVLNAVVIATGLPCVAFLVYDVVFGVPFLAKSQDSQTPLPKQNSSQSMLPPMVSPGNDPLKNLGLAGSS
jgi:hypothetical protein